MEVAIVVVAIIAFIIFISIQNQKTRKKRQIRALFEHELDAGQRFIDDANRMKNIDPILERIKLAAEATLRAKQYIQTDKEKKHIEQVLKSIVEERDRFIVEYHEEKMMGYFKKSETQVTLRSKINSLNKGIELHNRMKIDFPYHSKKLDEIRLKLSSLSVEYTLNDFKENASKQEYLGRHDAAVKIYKEALWFIDQSKLLNQYKEKYANEITDKIKSVKKITE